LGDDRLLHDGLWSHCGRRLDWLARDRSPDHQIDYDVDLAGTEIPTFTEIELPQSQSHSDATSLPFTGGAAIDIDGDGVDELFIGGGQNDVVYKYNGSGFDEVADAAGITKPDGDSSLSALVLDTDKDGRQDLIVTRPEGIWLYNNQGGTFEGKKLDAPTTEETTPLSVAVADINGDGHFDMYVSGYIRNDLVEGLNIFNKEGYGGTSALLINRGDDTFEDQTDARGLLYTHNTFQSAFSDFDLDSDLDLIVAHDTGQVKTWENTGDGNFVERPNPNSDEYAYPLGIAIGDYDNDSLVDFFFSNVGSSPPHFMVKGDLRDDQQHNWNWLLFRNKEQLEFEEVGAAAKLADYEFAWGAAFEAFLKELFDAYGLGGRASFRLYGEQIGGSFVLAGQTYLLEAKWTNKKVDAATLRSFNAKVEDKAAWSRGLLVSQSGFTEEGLTAFGRGKSVICMDGLDLYDILDQRLSFSEVLAVKVRRAAETGLPFVRVRDLGQMTMEG